MLKSLLLPTLLALTAAAHAETPPPKKAQRQAPVQEAKAAEFTETVSEGQLAVASRVRTGKASCEFNQSVSVEPLNGHPGVFKVAFKNVNYTMVPEETTSGAVRLQDKKAGVVWLQIPSKSMLMNSKLGQRLVDNCTQSEQSVAGK